MSTAKPQLPPELAEVSPPIQLRLSKIASYILYGWVLIGITALVLRIFLLLFSANMTTPFVNFIIRLSDDYLRPFRDIFLARPVGETGYFDVAAVFAIFIYLVLAWAAGAAINYVQSKIDENDRLQRQRLHYLRTHSDKEDREPVDTTPHIAATEPTPRRRKG